MSSNSNSSYSTFTSTTYTSSTTPSGTTITVAHTAAGEEPRYEQSRFETGQPSVLTSESGGQGGALDAGEKGRIEDVTEQENRESEREKEVDRKYREAMEDEYAKREGGA